MGVMSWKPEVLVEGSWSGNGLVFQTRGEAEAYGRDLLMRWYVPVDSRAVESSEPANYRRDPDTGAISKLEGWRLGLARAQNRHSDV